MNTQKIAEKFAEVIIDGVRYAPAREIVVNRERFLRVLVGNFWGNCDDKDLEWLEKEATEIFVLTTDMPERHGKLPSIMEIIERLAF